MLWLVSGQIPGFVTSTEKLQEWNKPRRKKLETMPVAARKQVILNKVSDLRPVPSLYDPRPVTLREFNPDNLEGLRVDLLMCNPWCSMLQLLVPPPHEDRTRPLLRLPCG